MEVSAWQCSPYSWSILSHWVFAREEPVLQLGAFMPPLGGSFEPPLGPIGAPLWECQVRTVARAGTHTAEQDVWIGVKIGP